MKDFVILSGQYINFPHLRWSAGSEIILKPIFWFKEDIAEAKDRAELFQINCAVRDWTPRRPVDWSLPTGPEVEF